VPNKTSASQLNVTVSIFDIYSSYEVIVHFEGSRQYRMMVPVHVRARVTIYCTYRSRQYTRGIEKRKTAQTPMRIAMHLGRSRPAASNSSSHANPSATRWASRFSAN